MYPKTISDIVMTMYGKYDIRNRIYRSRAFKQVLFKLCGTIIKNLSHCPVYKNFKGKDKKYVPYNCFRHHDYYLY